MLFVKTDELRAGMRLARPIFNKNGVLLYERNTHLTAQGIYSIKNFGLIGIYVLEPAEPVPPMSIEDIEFERFQTMAVFSLKEDLQAVLKKREPQGIYRLANEILSDFGTLNHKINFIQNLRSTEDYVYKHSLNVAILCAMVSYRMKLGIKEQLDVVMAALLHDVGKLLIPPHLAKKEQLDEEQQEFVERCIQDGHKLLGTDYAVDVSRIITLTHRVNHIGGQEDFENIPDAVRVMMTANEYDKMTAMQMRIEPISEVAALRKLVDQQEKFGEEAIAALTASINILSPAVCVELTNGKKGLVISENIHNVLKPMVLCFDDNKIYDLGSPTVYEEVHVKDVMKTMDNRFVIDRETFDKFEKELEH